MNITAADTADLSEAVFSLDFEDSPDKDMIGKVKTMLWNGINEMKAEASAAEFNYR